MERLGIAPLGEQVYRLASGQTIRRQTGGALFKYGDKMGVAVVVFGELMTQLSWDPTRSRLSVWASILSGASSFRCR